MRDQIHAFACFTAVRRNVSLEVLSCSADQWSRAPQHNSKLRRFHLKADAARRRWDRYNASAYVEQSNTPVTEKQQHTCGGRRACRRMGKHPTQQKKSGEDNDDSRISTKHSRRHHM